MMKKYLTVALLVLSVCFAEAQTKPDTARIFKEVDTPAEFPGGLDAFVRFLGKQIVYPADARAKHIQGSVYLTYVIEKDGSLTGIRVSKSVSKELDAEAIRIIKLSPQWVPGKKAGVIVRQQYTVPVSFTLTNAR